MVVFQGYCRPLKQKVEFQVESVNRLETKRGIKWSVKGHYEGNKISTFTNEENAQRLLEQLDNTVVEEPMEVFGAEIAYQEAEDDDVNAKVYFFHKGDEINFEVKNSKDINKIVKDIKSKVDFYPNTFDIEVIEGENLNYHTYIKQPSNTNKVNYILKKEEPILKRGKRGAKGMKMGLLAEDMRSGLTAKHYKKDGLLDLRYKICREIAAAEKKNAEESKSQTKKEDKDIDDEVEEILTEAAVDEVLESETIQDQSFEAESVERIMELENKAKKLYLDEIDEVYIKEVCDEYDLDYYDKQDYSKACSKYLDQIDYIHILDMLDSDDLKELKDLYKDNDISYYKQMGAESFDAETYQKVYRAEPNAIIFEEHIPPEIWNIMGPDAQGHYLATRDESVLIAPCCGVTKAEMRVDNDANIECGSCVFSGDDFHPRWWADKPVPKIRKVMDAEELPMEDLYGNTATVPADVYYRFMLQLPPTVSATPTDDGFSMILGFHNQNAEFVENLIEAYSPYEDAGDSQDTLYAEDISFVPKNPTGAVLTLNKFAEELENYGAEMSCPPATQDVAINTKNRNATIKNFGYGPLNVDEPGDFWEDIAKQWKTTVKAAKKSKCGNCVAFDRSPRMKACMPGETSDGEGVLGYCWMHHFKCHSARTCDTWAKGGPITTDKVSEGWQERAFAKPKASKTATEAGKATAKASESFEAEHFIGDSKKRIALGKKMVKDAKDMQDYEYQWTNIEKAGQGLIESDWKKFKGNVNQLDTSPRQVIKQIYGKSLSKMINPKKRNQINLFDAESFDVEFEEWGKQEMLTHGKDVSFKDWLEEEADSHGDMPLVEWAKDEEKSHDERYEAEKDNHYFEFNFEMLDSNDKSIDFYVWSSPNGLSYTKATKLAKNHAKQVAEKGVEPYSPKPNKRVSKIKFTSVRKISGDYKKQEEYSPNRYPLEINLGAESFEAESDKPVNKTLVGVLGVGVLGAIFAPKYVKSLFDKINKR